MRLANCYTSLSGCEHRFSLSGPMQTTLRENRQLVCEQEATRMKMLLNVVFPHEPFNTLVRDGKADRILTRML